MCQCIKRLFGFERIELDVRPAATASDMLGGIIKFRSHAVHFSGHSNENLVVFKHEIVAPHKGHVVTTQAFRHSLSATDELPLLILLNACRSAEQIDQTIAERPPFAIGMAGGIDAGDTINYAAQLYTSVASGQSIRSAHLSGRAALEVAGLSELDLPTLAFASEVDPSAVVLVTPAEKQEEAST